MTRRGIARRQALTPPANRELFDAIQHAATDARLDLGDLVDAYAAGARGLDLGEAFADVQDYLGRIADAHQRSLSAAFAHRARAARPAPPTSTNRRSTRTSGNCAPTRCDLLSILTAAAWLAAERARLAQQRDSTDTATRRRDIRRPRSTQSARRSRDRRR